jgi:putative serine/threonine protein kinase
MEDNKENASEEESRLRVFLEKKGLFLVKTLAKGFSSRVFLVKDGKGKKFAVKLERFDSPRKDQVEREARNLMKVNRERIGPKLVAWSKKERALLLEYVEGPTFSAWLLEKHPAKKEVKKVVKALLRQAKKLDCMHLDHGQLAGKGKNILVRKALPVILDFEKASEKRKPHNVSQLKAFLFCNPHSAIAKKVREKMREK